MGQGEQRPEWWVRLAFVAILVLGVALRLRFLDEGSLFIDEGESSLNALSILEHGYPAHEYLGLPMFENTLTEPWPESQEYEFRDTSYSPRGMAIYHGWLPLYAIAASQYLHGIRPDVVTDPPRVQHDQAEIQTRIRAARLPSVFFGALFLVAMFLAGRAMFGVDAGLAAMLAGALVPKCVWLAQQARYYSAALALSTLAVFLAWNACRRGRWRDFLAAALGFGLLFHTSSLAFALGLLPCLLFLPGVLRHERGLAKLLAWALGVAVAIVPWLLWTGYLEHAARIPMARSMFQFPRDYFLSLGVRPSWILTGAVLALAFLGLWLARRRLPQRFSQLLADTGRPVLFLTVWVLGSYFGFLALVPAASCSMARLSHVLLAGPILLCAIGIAMLGRVALPGRSTALALAGTLAVLVSTGSLLRWQRRNPYETRAAFEMVEYLRGMDLSRDARIYALPYQHFCLTYYTGLPIQTIAPVRKSFLDTYPGEVVVLETVNRLPSPPWSWVQESARGAGVELDQDAAQEWVPVLHSRMIRAELTPLVREVEPVLDPQPAWVGDAVADLVAKMSRSGHGRIDFAHDNPAMFRDAPPMTMAEFWPAFFYRFVNPELRSGANANCAERMRAGRAFLMPSSWVVVRCPWPVEGLR